MLWPLSIRFEGQLSDLKSVTELIECIRSDAMPLPDLGFAIFKLTVQDVAHPLQLVRVGPGRLISENQQHLFLPCINPDHRLALNQQYQSFSFAAWLASPFAL